MKPQAFFTLVQRLAQLSLEGLDGNYIIDFMDHTDSVTTTQFC